MTNESYQVLRNSCQDLKNSCQDLINSYYVQKNSCQDLRNRCLDLRNSCVAKEGITHAPSMLQQSSSSFLQPNRSNTYVVQHFYALILKLRLIYGRPTIDRTHGQPYMSTLLLFLLSGQSNSYTCHKKLTTEEHWFSLRRKCCPEAEFDG